MHLVPLLLLLGLLIAGPVAPARLGPKRVSALDPGAGLQRHHGTDGSRLSWRGSSPPNRPVISGCRAGMRTFLPQTRVLSL